MGRSVQMTVRKKSHAFKIFYKSKYTSSCCHPFLNCIRTIPISSVSFIAHSIGIKNTFLAKELIYLIPISFISGVNRKYSSSLGWVTHHIPHFWRFNCVKWQVHGIRRKKQSADFGTSTRNILFELLRNEVWQSPHRNYKIRDLQTTNNHRHWFSA